LSAPTYPTPATLQAASETETAYGGLTTVWADVATIWIALKPGSATSDQLEQQRPVRIETASATARDDARAAAGQQLLAGDDPNPWRVLAVERAQPQPGAMTLRLDRNQ
jgi:head-tail adaptor